MDATTQAHQCEHSHCGHTVTQGHSLLGAAQSNSSWTASLGTFAQRLRPSGETGLRWPGEPCSQASVSSSQAWNLGPGQIFSWWHHPLPAWGISSPWEARWSLVFGAPGQGPLQTSVPPIPWAAWLGCSGCFSAEPRARVRTLPSSKTVGCWAVLWTSGSGVRNMYRVCGSPGHWSFLLEIVRICLSSFHRNVSVHAGISHLLLRECMGGGPGRSLFLCLSLLFSRVHSTFL